MGLGENMHKRPPHAFPRILMTYILVAVLTGCITFPSSALADDGNGVAADELGAGFSQAMLDISFEEACKMAQEQERIEGLRSSTEDGPGYDARLLTSGNYRKLMDYALQYRGWPYVWGGKSPSQGGFDCSGLVTWCYDNALGATMNGWYTNAARVYNDYCDYVSPANATPGDLVFWRGTYGSDINYISHVGIYCGGNIAYAAGDPIGYCQINSVTNIYGQPAQYFFGSLREVDDKSGYDGDDIVMYRMYNRVTGEHLYTASAYERNSLMQGDWNYEGVGWIAPKTGDPVYRLYNPVLGDHHYTTSAYERDNLTRYHGWNYESIGWYSGGTVPLYRQYNPGLRVGQHNYTANKGENDILCKYYGWRAEGIGWYGIG